MPKILTIVGARPQFVKAAVVSKALHSHSNEILVHTGQHYDDELSGSFFRDLVIPTPKYNLNIGSDSHGRQTGAMLASLEDVLITEKPDMVLIYGDTNSTLAGALAAVKLCIPIAHVEAGARNWNLAIPEEVNRIVADHISALLLCSTRTCITNLEKEGIREGVFFTGDVLLDLHLAARPLAYQTSTILDELDLNPSQYLLGTIHRPQNTDVDERLRAIFNALLELEETLVLPLHPRTVKNLQRASLYDRLKTAPNIRLCKPLGYLDFLRLELDARLILTDSGGVQREAYFCQRPCITLFHNTAWPETVEDGWNILVEPVNKKVILNSINTFCPTQEQRNVFGDGNAGETIVECILDYLEHPRSVYQYVD
ncbi:MAG: UDP-N-acetylglucosamine 2-epimerase (non-hydrolyzing) [Anaerolineales bacterium]|nr:UDP-N-acetylglucosamine 2-epimerase (non-hydrolyzing) [Anaerolineales bacterium]